MRYLTACIMLIAALLAIGVVVDESALAVGDPITAATSPDVGAPCTVVFRRDVLGLNRPVPLDANSVDGIAVSHGGTFLKLDDDWLVLTGTDEEHWIPRKHILLLRVQTLAKEPQIPSRPARSAREYTTEVDTWLRQLRHQRDKCAGSA